MIDYEAWNPSFAGSEIIPVEGNRDEEGGLILIRKSHRDKVGEPIPEFLCETVKIVPGKSIVWYVYPTSGNLFANFVDFSLAEVDGRVKFKIHYYAQDGIPRDGLSEMRSTSQQEFAHLADCFKDYCEGRTKPD
jgi:hypothetical protein